jgi:hypothetical protein
MSSDPGPTPTSTPLSPSDLALAEFIAGEPGWLAEPACCCPSQPRFRVLMPVPGALADTDLLLCGHHFRISRLRLAELGALVYDRCDEPLSPAAWRLGEQELLAE